ncbi:MAG: aminotransferase family protein [Chloroflexota bacterium]
MAGYSTEEIGRLDVRHVLHGNTNMYDFARGKGYLCLVKGEGIYVWDADGKRYIDGFAGLWNTNVGHGRKEIAQAMMAQMEEIVYTPTILGLTNVPVTLLAKKLADLSPESINRFYFACGGAEANEVAFKIARYVNNVQGRKDRVKIVARQMGYHGLANATMWATALPQFHANFGPEAAGYIHIPAPFCYRCPFGKESCEACGLECAQALEGAIQAEGEDTVAAFIGEPVMGTGGVIVPPDGYWQKIREICTKYGVMLIADEVITGFGRTGTFWGMQQWNVVPDMMSMAKGITSAYQPLAALGVSDAVFERMSVPGQSFNHSYTYSGHPVVCAAALANIDIIINEGMVANAKGMGHYLNERLAELNELPYVGETRGIGLMAAVELVANKQTKAKFDPKLGVGAQITKLAREKGLLLRAGDEWLALSPPLIVTRAQVDEIVDVVRYTITSLKV